MTVQTHVSLVLAKLLACPPSPSSSEARGVRMPGEQRGWGLWAAPGSSRRVGELRGVTGVRAS